MVDKGYTSPIDLEIRQIAGRVADSIDNQIVAAVQATVTVDKNRLIQALNNDRQTYLRGFDAGVNSVLNHAHWIERRDADGDYRECSYCGESLPRYDVHQGRESIEQTPYCPYCGMIMDEKVSE